jgi:hypothetical protein
MERMASEGEGKERIVHSTLRDLRFQISDLVGLESDCDLSFEI